MASIVFNNIPAIYYVPSILVEVDNTRALKPGLIPNPHRVLIIGQKLTVGASELYKITRDGEAELYFGAGSMVARMINIFRANNPNIDMYAIGLDDDGASVANTIDVDFNAALPSPAKMLKDEVYQIQVDGMVFSVLLKKDMEADDASQEIKTYIDKWQNNPFNITYATGVTTFTAKNKGEASNFLDVRNYGAMPTSFTAEPTITNDSVGATNPTMGTTLWTAIENEQFHHIIFPYTDSANLSAIDTELETRWQPLVELRGHAYTAARGTSAELNTRFGDANAPNSWHTTIIAADDSPSSPELWAAATGAIASRYLQEDPARPLQTLQLTGIEPPPKANQFAPATQHDLIELGMSTFIVTTSGKVQIQRLTTTYRKNQAGFPDISYFDVNIIMTLIAIIYQYQARMYSRFIVRRCKLADDGFPVIPGSYVVTPRTIKNEISDLMVTLRDAGLIENPDQVVENLIVERDTTDPNRVNVLLAPDLINQFRVLATLVQFLL